MTKKIKNVLLLGLFLFCITAQAKENTPKILFVFYDAGETNALKPVLKVLDQRKETYRVLVMATASVLMQGEAHALDINKDCGVKRQIDSKNWPRQKSLKDSEIAHAVSCVTPKMVVTGMASQIQLQLVESYRNKQIPVFAYYDSFSPLSKESLGSAFLTAASVVLVPSETIADSIGRISPETEVRVVGQPSLEIWREWSQKVKRRKIAAAILPNKHKKTILYAGGYGENYEEAFASFATAARKLDEYNVIVSLHPKVDGSLERKVLQKTGAETSVKIIPKTVSTVEAATVSDVLVTQRSTVGVQVLSIEKPSIYFDLPGTKYKDIAIEKGWSPQVTDEISFLKEVRKALEKNMSLENIFEKGGIPSNAAQRIANLL